MSSEDARAKYSKPALIEDGNYLLFKEPRGIYICNWNESIINSDTEGLLRFVFQEVLKRAEYRVKGEKRPVSALLNVELMLRASVAILSMVMEDLKEGVGSMKVPVEIISELQIAHTLRDTAHAEAERHIGLLLFNEVKSVSELCSMCEYVRVL